VIGLAVLRAHVPRPHGPVPEALSGDQL